MPSSVVVPAQAEAGPRSHRPLAEESAGRISRGGPLGRLTTRVAGQVAELEVAACEALQPLTLPALRILLGVLFIWFGGLKLSGASPVETLVSGTLPWVDAKVAVVGLGSVEVLLGTALVIGLLLRVVLPILVAHLTGTFLTFVMLPGLMVSGDNPLLLTESGEFVVKNVALISAALVLMTHTRRRGSVAGRSR